MMTSVGVFTRDRDAAAAVWPVGVDRENAVPA